ncbi:hyperpolarization activated cyclic nucleotide-gated potassium channel 5 [Denticeps clupeoides]|uniref:Cyclic nucleotide-binding domain-containing protein n=1 Tax=Denticeps clupeoides TaxID=299321 RepID=A0AAY4DS76_9TELE|nr:potassium/sodium hyperpolarization-activated cyclic nucleotide-gated channel 1-like [Denticeps clupeoides]
MEGHANSEERHAKSGGGWRTLLLPQMNRQSLYVYGSEVAVERECIRQKESGVLVIHPFSPIRGYYIMCMMAVTFLNLIGIPIEIAFLDGHSSLGWEGFNIFSDTLFLFDVALNFRMGIIHEESETAILDLKTIRKKYLKSWFIPDLIAAFPVAYILIIADLHYTSDAASSKHTKMVRFLMFVRIISLVRLLRVSRLVRFFNEVERGSKTNLEAVRMFFKVLSLFMMVFLLCHWNGCIQYFVPMLKNFPPDCWVAREKLTNATVVKKYSFAVFRAFSHMISISYGASGSPKNASDLWVVMTSVVSGALMYTVLVANSTVMIAQADPTAKAYKRKMNELNNYMTFWSLPLNIRERITKYYQCRYVGKYYNEKEVLNSVSSCIREEMLKVMCARLVKSVPFFRSWDENFISVIILHLQYEVYQEGDIIVHQETVADRMFFIEHGQVLMEANTFKKDLCDGDYFEEECLLFQGKRLARFRALTPCHIYSLAVETFQEILQDFPEVKQDLEAMAGVAEQAL